MISYAYPPVLLERRFKFDQVNIVQYLLLKGALICIQDLLSNL